MCCLVNLIIIKIHLKYAFKEKKKRGRKLKRPYGSDSLCILPSSWLLYRQIFSSLVTQNLVFPRNKPVAKDFYSAQIQEEADSPTPALPVTSGARRAILRMLLTGVFYPRNLHFILLCFQHPK